MTAGAPPTCQACGSPLTRSLVDLGVQPLANSYIPLESANRPEPRFPLHARVCDHCLLVQVDIVKRPDEIFVDYAYFSSFSESWLAALPRICRRDDRAVRPWARTAASSRSQATTATCCNISSPSGIPGARDRARGQRGQDRGSARRSDRGRILRHGDRAPPGEARLAGRSPRGQECAGPRTGHQRFRRRHPDPAEARRRLYGRVPAPAQPAARECSSTRSITSISPIFRCWPCEPSSIDTALPSSTWRSSRRMADRSALFAARDDAGRGVGDRVGEALREEIAAGLDRPEGYAGFEAKVRAVRDGLLDFLAQAARRGKSVAAYGAAAKGNTLLNYCGVTERISPLSSTRILPSRTACCRAAASRCTRSSG